MTSARKSSAGKYRILCVDDERSLLDGLSLTLGRRYEVETALGGAQALELLERDSKRAVIMSDMRMPGMDGATFLAKARVVAPEAARVLLTGQTEIDAAISAVNDGQIFRFLTKPCAPPTLLAAIASAVEQHELITAQRVLLEETLHGCIRALTDVLALTNPAAFGRGTRIKQMVSELAAKLELRERWQVEVAAMLSQLGHITLPAETAERVYFGRPLSAEEQKQVDKLPALTEQLLGNIPRIESVREILASYSKPPEGAGRAPEALTSDVVFAGAQLLRAAVDFDALESQGMQAARALETMRNRAGTYDPRVLEALIAIRGKPGPSEDVRELTIHELCVGMVLTEDVKMTNGMLLAARGYEITLRFLERIRHFPKGALKERLCVIVRRNPEGQEFLARTLGYRR
jgi:response regulator RpfG family c-di-GMP phosphodiesterase